MNLFEEAKYIHSNKLTEEDKDVYIFHEVASAETEDPADWLILDNDLWYADGDGLILQGNRTHNELIFSKNNEYAIHNALERVEGKELLQELKRITGLDYIEDTIEGYNTSQKVYYPKGAFDKESIDIFSDAYFGNYTAYETADEDVDPPLIYVFDSDRRAPEEIIAAETRLPKNKIVIKKIKGYKKVPIYED